MNIVSWTYIICVKHPPWPKSFESARAPPFKLVAIPTPLVRDKEMYQHVLYILYTAQYSSTVVVGSRLLPHLSIQSHCRPHIDPLLFLFPCAVRDARISFRPVERYAILYHETDEY